MDLENCKYQRSKLKKISLKLSDGQAQDFLIKGVLKKLKLATSLSQCLLGAQINILKRVIIICMAKFVKSHIAWTLLMDIFILLVDLTRNKKIISKDVISNLEEMAEDSLNYHQNFEDLSASKYKTNQNNMLFFLHNAQWYFLQLEILIGINLMMEWQNGKNFNLWLSSSYIVFASSSNFP